MKSTLSALLLALGALAAHAQNARSGNVQLLCHRTANKDVPENTLASLEQAALLGCNVVEIDLRRTLDGTIVLNHDGILERLTDGVGDVETSYYGDLALRDTGSWMAQRFAGMHIALFEDALRLARQSDIRLILDMKDKGMATDVLRILEREGMLQRVQFGGEWDDVKKLYPASASVADRSAWVQPGVTSAQVEALHRQGKAVIANFSANEHEMDLDLMKAAVAAGVDGINVDYPRLAADAVGRPVERRLHDLIAKANAGDAGSRSAAILDLSRYSGFPLEEQFATWLLDRDEHVSRVAALALVAARPLTPASVFAPALTSATSAVRVNAAWALGMLRAPSEMLTPLLGDSDPQVLQAALLALGRTPGEVGADRLLPLLAQADPRVRGAAAVALARHLPEIAAQAVPAQLRREMAAERILYDEHVKRGGEQFTKPEIDAIMKSFRCQMEMMRALAMLDGNKAAGALLPLALRPDKDFSQFNAMIAGFQLWDHAAELPEPLVQALASSDRSVADRAEWALVKAGSRVLPEVRRAIDSPEDAVRTRAIRILAWQGDAASLDKLKSIRASHGPDAVLAGWAIAKILDLHAAAE